MATTLSHFRSYEGPVATVAYYLANELESSGARALRELALFLGPVEPDGKRIAHPFALACGSRSQRY